MNISRESKYFDGSTGFGEHRETAIKLMKLVIEILDEFGVDYFLISGTLLGLMRHNDFIPWDDDIDLIVSEDILGKIGKIYVKYNKELIIKIVEKYLIKVSFRNTGIKLKNNTYKWPFIDLFTYHIHSEPLNKLEFFNKLWPEDKFYPPIKTTFLDIQVKIPRYPHFFLCKNYGLNYMTTYKSSSYLHKEEKHINKVIKYIIN